MPQESLTVNEQAGRLASAFPYNAKDIADEIIADNELFYVRLSRWSGMTNLDYWKAVRQRLEEIM